MSGHVPPENQQIEGLVEIPMALKQNRIPGRLHDHETTNTTPNVTTQTVSTSDSKSTFSSRLPRETPTPGNECISNKISQNQQDVAILMQDLQDVQRQLDKERISRQTLQDKSISSRTKLIKESQKNKIENAYGMELKKQEMEKEDLRRQISLVTQDCTLAISLVEQKDKEVQDLQIKLNQSTKNCVTAIHLVELRDREVYGQATKIEKMKIKCIQLSNKIKDDEQSIKNQHEKIKELDEKRKESKLREKCINEVLENTKKKCEQMSTIMEERNVEVEILNKEIISLHEQFTKQRREIDLLNQKNKQITKEKDELYAVCQELFEKFEEKSDIDVSSNGEEKSRNGKASKSKSILDIDVSSNDEEKSAEDEVQVAALIKDHEEIESCKCLIM